MPSVDPAPVPGWGRRFLGRREGLMDRMIRLAVGNARPADLDRWVRERDNIYRQVFERGWNTRRHAFTQHYTTEVLDASLLMMPLVDFVAPSDSMWLSTLDAMEAELVSDSLAYRYDPSASPDGPQGHEGTFSICTFWYVDALARSGRLEQARTTLHLSLINAAINLDHQLDHGPGHDPV